jgi:hypothetical protein
VSNSGVSCSGSTVIDTPTLRKSGKYPLPTAFEAILLHP